MRGEHDLRCYGDDYASREIARILIGVLMQGAYKSSSDKKLNSRKKWFRDAE